MKKEDLKFLKELQHEMLTQDHVCQASPRFWVVMDAVKDYWVDDNIDGMFIYSTSEGDGVFEGDLEELAEWIRELDGVEDCKFDSYFVEFVYKGEEYLISDIGDLESFLNEYEYDKGEEHNYKVGYYREREKIVENTMFLTLRECKEHIEANRHHYSDKVHSYAMTAWRSPQVARLYKILENTDWDNICSDDIEILDKIPSKTKESKSIEMNVVSKGKLPNKIVE